MTSATVTSVVVYVSDLERSIEFYTDLFSCRQRSRAGQRARLETEGGFAIQLRELGSRAMRAQRSIGLETLVWTVDSHEALDACEKALREAGGQVHVHELDGVRFVQGRDPDRIPVVIAHPDPGETEHGLLDPRLYE